MSGELPGMWEEADLMGGWADTDGMSARERLYAALMCGGPHSPDRSEKASTLLDAFAHELSEKIRDPKNWRRFALTEQTMKIYMTAGRKAAIIIDPKENTDGR